MLIEHQNSKQLTNIWFIQEGGNSLVPANGEELPPLQDVHDPCDLCVAVAGHVLEAAAIGRVPHLFQVNELFAYRQKTATC